MSDLEYIFHPRSIAVVGASPQRGRTSAFLGSLIEFGYKGKLYPVHPKADEVSGLKAYPSIKDIPGKVDHVICLIRAGLAPQLMAECITKGVKVIQFFSSGFSETGEEEGIRLEREIAEMARQSNVRVLGPNCMGIYYPGMGLSYAPFFPRESGSVGFISQSGGISTDIVMLGAARGVRFSKVVSYGNACNITEADLLEYFAGDPETRIIIGYLEGTRDGKRLVQALRKAARVKPVIILKGGRTEAGTKAAASHTGALSGSGIIWKSLFRQLGVIQISDMDELIDLVLLFQHLNPLQGRGVGLIGIGGGSSVLITDDFVEEGLVVPSFPEELRRQLSEIVPREVDPGTSTRNPVDLSVLGWNPDILSRALQAIAASDRIDSLLVHFGLQSGTLSTRLRKSVATDIDALIRTRRNLNKPLVMVLHHDNVPEVIKFSSEIQESCSQADIPVFPSFNRAARALSRFVQHHER